MFTKQQNAIFDQNGVSLKPINRIAIFREFISLKIENIENISIFRQIFYLLNV